MSWILDRAENLEVVKYGEFTLSSGKQSNHYVDARVLTLDGAAASYIAENMVDIALYLNAEAIGGLALGALPIVGSIVTGYFLYDHIPEVFYIRKAAKGYGLNKRIEGNLRSKVLLIDDVCTTGESLLEAVTLVENEGSVVCGVSVIVDREEDGGSKRLEGVGIRVVPLLTIDSKGVLRDARVII